MTAATIKRHRVRRGLDLPLAGAVEDNTIESGPAGGRVAVLADDYLGLKPRMQIKSGERVRVGTPLFEHRKVPGLVVTAPASGMVEAVARGERRALRSVIIARDGADEQIDCQPLERHTDAAVRALLQYSGDWTALRQRPFGTVPAPDASPAAIFVTALDTRPLAVDPAVALRERNDDLAAGLRALAALAPVHLCLRPDSPLAAAGAEADGVSLHAFAGPHPAGLPGLHIERILPVGRSRVAWHCDAQDAAAIGTLCRSGRIDTQRVVSIAGPQVRRPHLVRAPLGADLRALAHGELLDGDNRIIAGSVLDGRADDGAEETAFLGRYHRQLSALLRGGERGATGALERGTRRYSIARTFGAWLQPRRVRALDTSLHGARRTLLPTELFETVSPYRTLPALLLRALQARDLERAEELGALGLIEEDLALLSFVDPGKGEHGAALRDVLDTIAREG
ncbi:MAG: NADH:ubiquinone reductase (Na(+)-transporting) subunit A [Planctomycetota bacterium]